MLRIMSASCFTIISVRIEIVSNCYSNKTQVADGSGLGLAIVQQLCNAQGWEVSLQPLSGGGTVAVLRLKR